jgi:hypothetical protein
VASTSAAKKFKPIRGESAETHARTYKCQVGYARTRDETPCMHQAWSRSNRTQMKAIEESQQRYDRAPHLYESEKTSTAGTGVEKMWLQISLHRACPPGTVR